MKMGVPSGLLILLQVGGRVKRVGRRGMGTTVWT